MLKGDGRSFISDIQLIILELMSTSKDEDVHEVSDAIQKVLFYEGSNVELIVTLCKDHKPHSVAYLKTLVETTHQLLKMLENYSKSKGVIFALKKSKRSKKKAAQAPKEPSKTDLETPETATETGNTDQVQEDAGSEVEDDLPDKSNYVEREFRFSSIEAVSFLL